MVFGSVCAERRVISQELKEGGTQNTGKEKKSFAKRGGGRSPHLKRKLFTSV